MKRHIDVFKMMTSTFGKRKVESACNESGKKMPLTNYPRAALIVPTNQSKNRKNNIVPLDKWKIVKKIGGGGFGEIYQAQIMGNEEPVAIKVESTKQSKQVCRF